VIKFFRKLRYDLMEKNKTGKYLKYAIGEIVLVVIGILIALQINNWNENQKQNKIEISTLKALVSEFTENSISINSYQKVTKKRRLVTDSLRMQIGPKLTTLSIDNINHMLGEVGTINKCRVSIDILEDIQSSGKLNLISNEQIRRDISKWSSYVKELEGEEDDWARQFSQHFIPYSSKWIQWDDVDYQFNKDDPRYFESRFDVDPRLILQKPEFANIMANYYWRISRIEQRTDSLLEHTKEVLELIQQELKK